MEASGLLNSNQESHIVKPHLGGECIVKGVLRQLNPSSQIVREIHQRLPVGFLDINAICPKRKFQLDIASNLCNLTHFHFKLVDIHRRSSWL